MKSALVLEGGAKRGIYTAGVLDVLLEMRGKGNSYVNQNLPRHHHSNERGDRQGDR